MRDWLIRHAEPLQAVGALATAFAALTALVVIPYQVAQADRIQRDQTAREIYREFLNLTVQKPELAAADYCALTDGPQMTGYAAYVDYLLYTAEQMVDTSPDWQAPMASYMGGHMAYLCDPANRETQTDDVRELIDDLGLGCERVKLCG
ncbi:hypothetical protein [Paracoccus zhejiangensis]|uniref:hypothetical protein n=1 Tax=Paracoccus zhejiangensis TaxID=1077935 RepID=UPI0018E46118|nr:hypothetical protein [Paracoccus zhejiangensis]